MRWTLVRSLLAAAALLATRSSAEAGDPPLVLKCAQNTRQIQAYEVFELTFQHDGTYHNPFSDVTIDVAFTSPTGKVMKVGGFHYGSLEKAKITIIRPTDGHARAQVQYRFDKADTWKARLAPNEVGRWTYSYTFANDKGRKATGGGEFFCVRGRIPYPGFVRQDPNSPYQWVLDNGEPFFPMGFQDGLGDQNGNGTLLDAAAMEGPFRLDRANRPDPPPGAMFKPGPSMNPQNADVQFRRFSRCGFNMFRFSQQNCTYALNQNLDRYLVQEAVMTDELLQYCRKYRLRIFYGIFGFQKAFNDQPQDAAGMEKVKRFIKYSVDRWGAYADFWEFLNEQNADDKWYATVTPYLRSIDPYHHPVTTSWERPQLEGIDVSAPHWYVAGDELSADKMVADRAAAWKKFHKPVIVGEHGNSAPRDPTSRPAGNGGVWDPASALRMRIRNWSALFNEISFIFWNTSYAKDGHFMNIWLGPKEREYVRAMQDFAYCLGRGLTMKPATVSRPGEVRAYCLASDRRAGAYLHHFKDHTGSVKGLTVTLDVPKAAKGYWYSTETAAILKTVDAPPGKQTFAVPEFTVDLALLITPDGCPDIDKDGKPNDVDDDNDNDGVPNDKDAFPLEPEEWADRDGDGIGDNMDADKDADGLGDDDNHNGKPDCQELDFDGDGVPRTGAVPWDAFPNDPKEWQDTDGDGIGDNADDDDDGDGYTDEEEIKAGTDPKNKLSFPTEKV